MKISLRLKYVVLREIVILLGLFEYLGLGGGFYFLGSGDNQSSVVSFVILGLSYYISSKLGYYVSELLIKLSVGMK